MLALALGFGLGFVLAIPPLGPVAMLVVRHGLHGRHLRGLAIGVGSAVASIGWCAIATLGAGWLLNHHPETIGVLRWIGTLIVLGIGVHFLRAEPEPTVVDVEAPNGRTHDVLVGLGLGAVNPTRLLTWSAAVVVAVALGGPITGSAALLFPVAVGIGEIAWFTVFLLTWKRTGRGLHPATVHQVVRGMGAVLVAIALFTAWRNVTEPMAEAEAWQAAAWQVLW